MRIYCDRTTMPFFEKAKVEGLINAGNVLVFTTTAVDVSLLRDNLGWTEQMLKDGKIIIELWQTLDQMTAKPFYWSSAKLETPACNSFEKAIGYMLKSDAIRHLANLVNTYGIPKGNWKMGPWTPPVPITKKDADALGVNPETATRSDILAAAMKTGNLEPYTIFNAMYCYGLATQHCCDAILTPEELIII